MTISINERSKALYAEVQAAVGVKETFDATDILRTSNLQAAIYDGDTTTINYDGGTGRNDVERHTTFYNKFSFEADLIGGGDAGGGAIDPPPMADIIRACGYDMDVSTPGEVVFTMADRANIDVASLGMVRTVETNSPGDFRVYRYDTLNARGQLGISLSDDRPKFVVTDMTGVYERPVDVTSTPLGTEVPALTAAPVTFTNGAFNTLTFNGESLCTHAFTIPSLGWSVVPVDKPNCDDVTLQEQKVVIDITFKQLDWTANGNPFEWAEDHENANYYPLVLSMDDRIGHICKINATGRMMNVQEVALEDGNVGVQAQIEVQDNLLDFGFYSTV